MPNDVNHSYSMNRYNPGTLIIETQCVYCGRSIITIRDTDIFNAGKTSEPVCKICPEKEPQEPLMDYFEYNSEKEEKS